LYLIGTSSLYGIDNRLYITAPQRPRLSISGVPDLDPQAIVAHRDVEPIRH
jgi:hypothetical protein